MYLILVVLAGISFSISEVVSHFYERSPFYKSGRKFFDPSELKNATKFMGVTIHAIPVFNWITLLLLLAALPVSHLPVPLLTLKFMGGGWQLLLSIVIFVFSFNFSIHKMIKKDES